MYFRRLVGGKMRCIILGMYQMSYRSSKSWYRCYLCSTHGLSTLHAQVHAAFVKYLS